jgi:hypothetical protein
LTAQSTGGTGLLLRHRILCAHKADRAAKAQSVLNYSSDGSVKIGITTLRLLILNYVV